MAFTCSRCGQQYTRLWTLNRHMRICKVERSAVECEEESSTDDDQQIAFFPPSKKKKTTHNTQSSEGEDKETNAEDNGEQSESDMDNGEEFSEHEEECSESADEGEDVNMDEDERRKTRIQWPVSRLYEISYPWTFWGEIPRIKKHFQWLNLLRDSENQTVIYYIQKASDSQIAALCEIVHNYLYYQTPVERSTRKEMRKHKCALRLLADPDIDIDEKRDEILRKGASFVELLLHAIDLLFLSDIPRKLDDEEMMSE